MILVVIVVLVFLQGWRPAIIPIIAIPVSLVGTFAAMAALGYAINNLTLFGLVLAVGIVVDDAIVVVENVERHLEHGMSRRDAALKTMEEVGGALVSIALVLCAVFVPTAFLGGITGQFFQQFAVTIAVATAISCFCSLTLSPALASQILEIHADKRPPASWNLVARGWDMVHRAVQQRLQLAVEFLRQPCGLRDPPPRGDAAGLCRADRQRRLAACHHAARLYSGAGSRLRHHLRAIAGRGLAGADHRDRSPDREHCAGYARHLRISRCLPACRARPAPRRATRPRCFRCSTNRKSRLKKGLTAQSITADLRKRLAAIEGAFIIVIPPPPIPGIGTGGGFTMRIQDRQGRGPELLAAATDELVDAARKSPLLLAPTVFSPFSANTPQVFVDIDRVKAQKLGVPIQNITDTIETYFGSTYVNDLNLFGRTYHVTAQADLPFRKERADLSRLRTRNANGDTVMLGSVVDFKDVSGPDRVARYNLYPAAELQGEGRPGTSSATAIAVMKKLAEDTLPSGFSFEWTDLSYQQTTSGNAGLLVFPICVLFVYLVLAAQYGSWTSALCRPPDRADVPVGRDHRGADHGAGRQYPHPNRLRGAGRACGQERDPDCRIRPRHRERGPRPAGSRDRGLPAAAAPDPDDVVCVYPRRAAAGGFDRLGLGNAPGGRCRRVLRHAGRHPVRAALHADLLHGGSRPGRPDGRAGP